MRVSTGDLGRAAVVGVGATALLDLVGEGIRRATGVPPLDSALIGRWIGHMPAGRFRHDDIRRATPVPRERELGLATHYAIGVTFAVALAAACPAWLERPTLAPALGLGLVTVAAPWFLMQPAFGLGVAASRTPDPTSARLRSLRTHAVYGLGLYLSAQALRRLGGR